MGRLFARKEFAKIRRLRLGFRVGVQVVDSPVVD